MCVVVHKYSLHFETARLGLVSCKESLVHKKAILNTVQFFIDLEWSCSDLVHNSSPYHHTIASLLPYFRLTMNIYGANASPLQNTSYNFKVNVSIPWANFYFRVFRVPLWPWQFLWRGYRLKVFAPSSLYVWSKMPWINLQIRVLPRGFLSKLLLRFDGLLESGSVSPKTILILSKNFLSFWFDAVEPQKITNLSRCRSKGYTSVVLGNSEVTFLGERNDAAFCPSLYCVPVIYGIALSEQ